MTPTAQFRLFGTQHVIVLCVLMILGILVASGGRRLGTSGRMRLGRILGFLLLAYVFVLYTQEALMGGWHAAYSLPMQLCDWVVVACLITMFWPNDLASEIAYFWGIGGTLQAILTPDISQGFPSWRFIQFFWGHGMPVLCIVYILAVRRFRPRPRSTIRMMIATNIYGLAALLLDLTFRWNYGFLRSKPAEATLLNYLGPWPWYILAMEAIALAVFLLLNLPWKILDRLRAQPAAEKANRTDGGIS